MMGVAIAKLAGVPLPDLPPVLLFGAQAALGWIMGSRFDVIPFRDLRQMAVASFAGLAVGIGVAGLGCLLLIATTDLNAKALVLSLAKCHWTSRTTIGKQWDVLTLHLEPTLLWTRQRS